LSTNLIQKNIDLSQWVSQAEAARLRGVTRQAIAKLVRKGKLKTLEIGGYSLVNKQEVLKFKDGPAGRPRTKHGEFTGNKASNK
jgi:excisionase family DNA binding protein